MSCRAVILGSVATLGLGLIAAGIALTQGGPGAVHELVLNKLDISNEEYDGYNNFEKPPVSVQINFTFFEVMNPEEVSIDVKPILQERGPYVFIEHREKRQMSWYGKYENGSEDFTSGSKQFVKFGQYKFYTFDAEKSRAGGCLNCQEDDKVTIINMPLMGQIGKLNRMGKECGKYTCTAKSVLNEYIKAYNEETQMMGEKFVFDGVFFHVSIIDFLFRGIQTGVAGWMMDDVTFVTSRLPLSTFGFDNGFALFNHKNDTMENEWYEMETEEVSWDRRTMITKWGQWDYHTMNNSENNMMEDLSTAYASTVGGSRGTLWWNQFVDADGNSGGNNTCNSIQGTDGLQFPPMVSVQEREKNRVPDEVWIFNTALCRSIYVVKNGEVDVEGINTLEYSVPSDGANVNNSLNVCMCESLSTYIKENGVNNGNSCVERPPGGDTLDLTSCPASVTEGCIDGIQDLYYCQGSSVTLSYPHFYMAEDQTNYFNGLSPNADQHRFFLNVEPLTGLTLKLHSRIQLNVPLTNNEELHKTLDGVGGTDWTDVDIQFLDGLPFIPNFPVVWIDQGVDLETGQEKVDKVVANIVVTTSILLDGKWVAIGLGAGFVAVAAIFSLLGPWKIFRGTTSA